MTNPPAFMPSDELPYQIPQLAPEEPLPPPAPFTGLQTDLRSPVLQAPVYAAPAEAPPPPAPATPVSPHPYVEPQQVVPFAPVTPTYASLSPGIAERPTGQFDAVPAPMAVNQFGSPMPTLPPAPIGAPHYSAYNEVAGRGLSSEFNQRGHIAVAASALALLLISLQWIFGRGFLWLTAGIAVYAISQGVRGHNAANRGLATNAGVARLGLAMGIVALLGCVAYLLLIFAVIALVVA